LEYPFTKETHSLITPYQISEEAMKSLLLLIFGDAMQSVRVTREAIILWSNS
jgi:hypothetical protein